MKESNARIMHFEDVQLYLHILIVSIYQNSKNQTNAPLLPTKANEPD